MHIAIDGFNLEEAKPGVLKRLCTMLAFGVSDEFGIGVVNAGRTDGGYIKAEALSGVSRIVFPEGLTQEQLGEFVRDWQTHTRPAATFGTLQTFNNLPVEELTADNLPQEAAPISATAEDVEGPKEQTFTKDEAAAALADMVEETAKPKRTRRTKAEMEAARAAEAGPETPAVDPASTQEINAPEATTEEPPATKSGSSLLDMFTNFDPVVDTKQVEAPVETKAQEPTQPAPVVEEPAAEEPEAEADDGVLAEAFRAEFEQFDDTTLRNKIVKEMIPVFGASWLAREVLIPRNVKSVTSMSREQLLDVLVDAMPAYLEKGSA